MTKIRVAVKQPPSVRPNAPTTRPLTHHEILGIVGPFTARGRHLDMRATRRAERELHFMTVDHPSTLNGHPALREALLLTVYQRTGYRLVRSLTPLNAADGGPPATLSATGPDAAVLLDAVDRFPVSRHFPICDGHLLLRSYRLEPRDRKDAPTGGDWRARIVHAAAEIAGIRLDFDAELCGLPIKVSISAPSGQRLVLPRDLLAVLGWHYRSVEDYSSHWRGSIRAPKREPRRTPEIEERLDQAVRHLAGILSRPPTQFHARFVRARWRAAFQRGLPVFGALAMIGSALALTQVPIEDETLLKLLAFHVPPLMMLAFFFGFDYLPNFEIPRVPRALKQDGWLVSART